MQERNTKRRILMGYSLPVKRKRGTSGLKKHRLKCATKRRLHGKKERFNLVPLCKLWIYATRLAWPLPTVR